MLEQAVAQAPLVKAALNAPLMHLDRALRRAQAGRCRGRDRLSHAAAPK